MSEKNRIARLRWARKHISWTVTQWIQVLWTDESPFVFSGMEILVYGENRTNDTTVIAWPEP